MYDYRNVRRDYEGFEVDVQKDWDVADAMQSSSTPYPNARDAIYLRERATVRNVFVMSLRDSVELAARRFSFNAVTQTCRAPIGCQSTCIRSLCFRIGDEVVTEPGAIKLREMEQTEEQVQVFVLSNPEAIRLMYGCLRCF